MPKSEKDAAGAVARHLHPLTGHDALDPLLDRVGDARVVLLGEATHGTHEFYSIRGAITRRLIREKGFSVVAVEADWPDAYRVNRYVRGMGEDPDAQTALAGFRRFPTWMWRNTDVVRLVEWLRRHNAAARPERRAGFYGIDLYSLYTSIEAVLEYLAQVDPAEAGRARERYACFEHFAGEAQAYGYAASSGARASCEDDAVEQLVELRRRAADLARRDGRIPEDEFFYAEQNARLVRNAEEYYRAMYRGRVASWNLRDRHMAKTLESLLEHFDAKANGVTRAVVWAHNSHNGDARATEMGRRGEWNVGQLARERFGDDAVLVGFTTYDGTVAAAHDWDGAVERKQVRPGLPGSYEAVLHGAAEQAGAPAFLVDPTHPEVADALAEERLERAIGVIYRPQTERQSHYFHASLPAQFDQVIHVDRTRAVRPLERHVEWSGDEPPETFPSGL